MNRFVLKNRDEVGDLAQAFNQMAVNLKDLITNVRHNTVQVSGSAAELTASADQTIQATEQITSSIQEVASGSEAQGKNATESSEAMKKYDKGHTAISIYYGGGFGTSNGNEFRGSKGQ
ncbi:methyl-accepting chemotaxis protein [Lysinibacillus sp. MHQ-1]|nr:methyl-accepting chemotaxis protein [Lysinibacillus sp. MHQ-1]